MIVLRRRACTTHTAVTLETEEGSQPLGIFDPTAPAQLIRLLVQAPEADRLIRAALEVNGKISVAWMEAARAYQELVDEEEV